MTTNLSEIAGLSEGPALLYIRFADGEAAGRIRKWSQRPFDGATVYARAGNGSPLGPMDGSDHVPINKLPQALEHVAECLWVECEQHVIEDAVRIVTDAAAALRVREEKP